MGVAETAAYSAAKAGLIGLTRALAREFGPRGIRVNAVAPGVTITEMTTDLVDSEEGRRRLRDMPLGRFGRADEVADAVVFLLSRPRQPVPRPDPQPQRRGLHAVTQGHRRPRGGRAGSRRQHGGHRRLRRRPRPAAALHRRAGGGLHRRRPAARPDDGPRRRHRRLRRPRLLAARPARADAPDDRQQHRQRAAPRRAGRGQRDRVVLVPAGRALAADARDRRGTPGARHARRAGHVRRPAPDRWQAERAHDRGPRRGRHAARPGMAALPRVPDRRRGHPRHDRRRGRQPHDGGRGRPGRDAGDGHGRAQQRRHRHRPGPPARDARQPAHARREGARRPGRPRLRRPGPVADLHHPGLAVLRGRPAQARDRRAAAAARRAQDHRPALAARVPARRHLQPRLRDQPAHRPGRLGGGHHRPARADRRAGHLRRRAGRRERGRRRASTTRR